MIKVPPQEFVTQFHRAFQVLEADLNKVWDDERSLTSFMRETLLQRIAKYLNLKPYTNADYYTLDGIFYESLDHEHFYENTFYAHYVCVAIEVENIASGPRGSVVEMNKLQIFNTPLKVLITYAPKEEHSKYLGSYTNIIQKGDVFGDFHNNRRQLVVFGSTPDSKNVQWDYYVYEKCGFASILPQT